MKRKSSIILLCLIGILQTFCQEYYWYRGKQVPLQQGLLQYILYEDDKTEIFSTIVFDGGEAFEMKDNHIKWGIINKNATIDNSQILYKTSSFLCLNNNQNMFVTYRFYVKLKKADDLNLLQNLLIQYNAEIEREGDFPLWYIIRCGIPSTYNALELSNIFYESGLFSVAEPEFLNAIQMDCVNDSLFSSQWNLRNTGQYGSAYYGIDINYCEARAISAGGDSSVVIGVYDTGVDLTHPDIHFYPYSYDAHTGTSPSSLISSKPHGTNCAGIISAKTNNSIGVAGIAPYCRIMSLSWNSATTSELGNGFKVAADQGCSVISNSWFLDEYSSYVDEGISYALSHGRNGKGCVVVFSAGNNNLDSVNYPANSNDSILVVGAMSQCGERKSNNSCDLQGWWGSNYGNKLDVVAPGVAIRTTDIVGVGGNNPTDYRINFNGTSSACPHVAAIAGLVLSINPNLTQKEVADIIESTSRKVGTYSYTIHSGRTNGKWNYEMGYGLVDAYWAVWKAKYQTIQGPDYICYGDTVCYYLPEMPSGASFNWSLNTPSEETGTYRIVQGQGTSNLYVTHTDPYSPLFSIESDNSTISKEKDGREQPSNPNHDNTVNVVITTADNRTYTLSKTFHAPIGQVPTISASNSSVPWFSGTTRFFTITNNTSVSGSLLNWEIMQVIFNSGTNNDTTIHYYTGRNVSYTPYIQPRYLGFVTITAYNTFEACGEQSSSLEFGITNKNIHFSAAVDGNQLNIFIYEEDLDYRAPASLNNGMDYTLELWHSIYGCMRTKIAHSTTEQLDITGLPQGVYVLLLKENSDVIAQTKVQIE